MALSGTRIAVSMAFRRGIRAESGGLNRDRKQRPVGEARRSARPARQTGIARPSGNFIGHGHSFGQLLRDGAAHVDSLRSALLGSHKIPPRNNQAEVPKKRKYDQTAKKSNGDDEQRVADTDKA